MPNAKLILAALALGAVTVAAGSLAQSSLPLVEISYTYPGPIPKDLGAVQDALSALTRAKINATVKLEPVDWGSYDQKRSLALSAGEKCDVMFTAPWSNSFARNVQQGNLLALDDLLKKSAPKLYATLAPSAWNAARVEGKIYGVINQQAYPKTWGFIVNAALAKKYNLNLNNVRRLPDLEPFLAAVRKNEPGILPVNGVIYKAEYLSFDPVVDNLVGVRYSDASLTAVSIQGSSAFRDAVLLARKWYQAGYYSKDRLELADVEPMYKAGKFAVVLDQWRPDSQTQWRNRYGGEIVGKSLSTPFLSTAAMTATMNGVCRTSANPERAMMFLELLNTDKQVYNTLSKGIEGKHWVWKDKARGIVGLPEGVTTATSGYAPGTDWMFGSVFNAYANSDDALQETKDSIALNKSARASSALGFSFDQEPVKTEIANLNAVYTEYGSPLASGLVDPTKGLPEYLNRLKAAGIDRVVAEVQRQLNTFKAKK